MLNVKLKDKNVWSSRDSAPGRKNKGALPPLLYSNRFCVKSRGRSTMIKGGLSPPGFAPRGVTRGRSRGRGRYTHIPIYAFLHAPFHWLNDPTTQQPYDFIFLASRSLIFPLISLKNIDILNKSKDIYMNLTDKMRKTMMGMRMSCGTEYRLWPNVYFRWIRARCRFVCGPFF